MNDLTGPVAPLVVPAHKLLLPFVGADGPAAQAGVDPGILALELFVLIAKHAEQRRPRLEWDYDLHYIAERRVANMRANQYVGHVDGEGHGPNWWLNYWGELPDWYPHGDDDNSVESIRLQARDATAADALDELLDSPRHREHILGEGDFFGGQSRCGIGCGPTWEEPVPAQFIFSILTVHQLGD